MFDARQSCCILAMQIVNMSSPDSASKLVSWQSTGFACSSSANEWHDHITLQLQPIQAALHRRMQAIHERTIVCLKQILGYTDLNGG